MKPVFQVVVLSVACAVVPVRAQNSASSGGASTVATPVKIDPTKPAFPGILTSSDPNKPPPFVTLANDPIRLSVAVDAATAAIPSALRSRTDAAHANWLKTQGGADFRADLSYGGGRPIMLLIVASDESVAAQTHRMSAIFEACSFLLQDDAFDQAIICISTYDPAHPQTMTTRNTPVSRAAFQAALKKAGKSIVVATALTAVRGDDSASATRQICTDLAIR